MPSEIDFANQGDPSAPSPSIWADCPKTLLVDKGLGFYAHNEFLGFTADTIATAEQRPNFDQLFVDADDASIVSSLTGKVGGYLKLVTAATDNNAFALFSAPLGAVVLKSGNKLWFEARLQLNELADAGVFVGVTQEAAAAKGFIVNDPSNSAVATVDATRSSIGFVSKQTASAIASFTAQYKSGSGAVVTVASDVTNSSAIPTASKASIAATTEFKLGFRFNGRDKLYFYANGFLIGTQTVDSTVDTTNTMAAIVAYKVGTAAAKGFAVDWVRYAFQARS